MSEELFKTQEVKHNTILLIDASGSVISDVYENDIIFNKIKKIIDELTEEEYRVIFWNSDKHKNDHFKNGIYRLPFIVKKSTLSQAFYYVKNIITNHCLTFPHLAFENISTEWINNKDPTKIYFITDGKMGYYNINIYEMNTLKSKLSEAIKNIFEKYNNIQLNIITVEPIERDFNKIETLTYAAGCDVYNVIMENKLTKYITKFISYTPNNRDGFIHINKNIPPPGYCPFGDKYFSQLRVKDFINYLIKLVEETQNEDELLKIVQQLSSTLAVLTRDKPNHMVKDIIKTFCEIFERSQLDIMFVKFILEDAIKKENEGMANIFALYRAQLKDLYKRANELLGKNVKEAIGIGSNFMTFPLNNKIIIGNYRLIDKNIALDKIYPSSGIKVNNILLPIIPLELKISQMSEQCLRQWVRQIIGRIYKIGVMDDMIIYIVLGIVLQVIMSEVEERIKDAYRKLGHIMLKKKRFNTDMTELERLENGEAPIPNSGKIEDFIKYMKGVNTIFEYGLEPFELWYAICIALNNEKMIVKQLIHCDIKDPKNVMKKIQKQDIKSYKLPIDIILDYKCLITLEDTSENGGFRFLPHRNNMGNTCSPICVLSEDGYKQLLSDPTISVCPICYTQLDETNFEKVSGKKVIETKIFTKDDISNIFYEKKSEIKPTIQNKIEIDKIDKKGTLIILKGTVGCGKTTAGEKIKKYIEDKGGYCIVEGTDKYCKDGIPIQVAISKVKYELLKIQSVNNDNLVVVIDTCGEKTNKSTYNNIFGVDFTKWKIINFWPNLIKNNTKEYLAWSLRNVLNRDNSTTNRNYYLNPDDAGFNTCITVHKNKARALFGKKMSILFEGSPPKNKSEAIEKISEMADVYANLLKEYSLDEEIEKLFG